MRMKMRDGNEHKGWKWKWGMEMNIRDGNEDKVQKHIDIKLEIKMRMK